MENRSEKGKSTSRQQYFASPPLGVSGYVDLIDFDGEGQPTPVEYKKAGTGNWLNDQVQLCLPDEVVYLKDLDQRPARIKPALGIDQVLCVDEPGVMLKKRSAVSAGQGGANAARYSADPRGPASGRWRR